MVFLVKLDCPPRVISHRCHLATVIIGGTPTHKPRVRKIDRKPLGHYHFKSNLMGSYFIASIKFPGKVNIEARIAILPVGTNLEDILSTGKFLGLKTCW